MNDPTSEIRTLSLGVRAVVLAFTLLLAFLNTQLAFSIELVRKLLQDAMPGAPLPQFALFIMQARTIWILVSFIPPTLAVLATFFPVMTGAPSSLFQCLSFLSLFKQP